MQTLSEDQIELIKKQLKEEKNLVVCQQNREIGLRKIVFVENSFNPNVINALKIESVQVTESGEINEAYLQQLRDETEVLRQSKHKYIATVVDDFVIDHFYFVQLDCSNTFYDWAIINCGKSISDAYLTLYANQFIDAIEYIHGKDCVLKEISVDSVLIDTEGDIKLYDFGQPQIFKFRSQKEYPPSFVQSLPYQPPEILQMLWNRQAAKQSQKGDIWSFGAYLSFIGGGQIMNYSQDIEKTSFMITYSKKFSTLTNEFIKNILQIDPMVRPSLKEIRENMTKVYNLNENSVLSGQTYTEKIEENQEILIQEEPNVPQQKKSFLQLSLQSFIDEITNLREIKSLEQKQQSNRIYLNILFVLSLGITVSVTSLEDSLAFFVLLCIQLFLSVCSFILDKIVKNGKFTSMGLLIIQSALELVTLIFANTKYEGINVTYALYVFITQIVYLGPFKFQIEEQSNDIESQNHQSNNNLILNKKNTLFYILILNSLPVFVCIGLSDSQEIRTIATVKLIVFFLSYFSIWVQIKITVRKLKMTSLFTIFIRFAYISLNALDFVLFDSDFNQVSDYVLSYFALANTIYIGIVATVLFNRSYTSGQLLYTFASVSSFVAQLASQNIQIVCFFIFGASILTQAISLIAMPSKRYRITIEKWIHIILFLIHIVLFSLLLNYSLESSFEKGRNYAIAFFVCLIALARLTLTDTFTKKQKPIYNIKVQHSIDLIQQNVMSEQEEEQQQQQQPQQQLQKMTSI